MIANLLRKIITFLNFIIPKNKREVIFFPFPNTETGSINTANTILQLYPEYKVSYVVNAKNKIIPYQLLDPKVNIIIRNNVFSLYPLFKLFRAKYVFITHGLFIEKFPKKQVVTNLWHGLMYKKIGKLVGGKPIITDWVVGTSAIAQEMFSDAFGVSKEQVTTTGYPRNDVLIRANKKKVELIKKLELPHHIQKIILWMPTYRKSRLDASHEDGVEVGNPFYIKDFDIKHFDDILKKYNAICYVKPHPLAPIFDTKNNQKIENVKFIDDEWIYNQGFDLYEFVGITDVLISDVSSIIFDYMLLDNPIVCISEDFEEYKQNRGYYFENIEEMIPTKVLKSQFELFKYLGKLLSSDKDEYKDKRIELKEFFFDFQDNNSTQRILNILFKYK